MPRPLPDRLPARRRVPHPYRKFLAEGHWRQRFSDGMIAEVFKERIGLWTVTLIEPFPEKVNRNFKSMQEAIEFICREVP